MEGSPVGRVGYGLRLEGSPVGRDFDWKGRRLEGFIVDGRWDFDAVAGR